MRAAWDALLRAALPPAPAEVVDLGCGTGTLSLLAAQQGHHVSGVDISPQMIERARTKVDAAGDSGRFRVGDAADPPWPAGSFDVVLARHVLWALPDPGEALDRWIALLAPDGRLVLIEGRWSTGAGLTADTVLALLGRRDRSATLVTLHDPHLWGGPIDDERYLLVSG